MSPQQSANAAREVLNQAIAAAGVGRYATAMAAVEHIRATDLEPSVDALIASCFRQLGAHDLASRHDATGLASTRVDPVGRADCATGWAADAIGTEPPGPDQLELVTHRLEKAAAATEAATGSGEIWRLRVRLNWVRAEAELLATNPHEAQVYADRAVVSSLLHGTQRHLAKSLLVQGVARLAEGNVGPGIAALERAAALADFGGLHPLRVPSHGLLAQLTDGDVSRDHRNSAKQAADLIAVDVPPECADWRNRPDILTLTGS